jgi:simple sugar transport system ATP-binding protein
MNGATNETMDATRREDRPHRSASSPVLSATGIAKRFDATVALAALDLSIGAGEVVALMGANGAGKSTFVKILSGALQADGGTLTLRGDPYRPASPHAAKRLGVATVHQSVADAVVPTLSIADNLLLDRLCDPASPWRAPPAARRAAALSLAARVGLDVDLAAPLASLSLADQQRVTLARALAGQPSLLILDEPTASLSAAEAERLFVLVDALRRDGVAILLVSHRLGDLRRIADRAAIVRDGRIVADLAAPIDFDAAVETMIGRPLPRARALAPEQAAQAESGPGSGFSVRQIRLTPTSTPFDLDVRRGEIVAIAGPVGGGKSRFARTIFGAVRAAAGEDRWRTSLFPDSVPFASIAGTIGFPFLSRWFASGAVRRARERTAAAAAIARFGIRCEGPDDRVAHLSGGNQQKVVLARWHAEPARLLLLDEPFQGIDAGARADIVDTLRRHAHERTTIVFVSDLEEAAEIADRIVRFDRATLDCLPPTSSIVGACS